MQITELLITLAVLAILFGLSELLFWMGVKEGERRMRRHQQLYRNSLGRDTSSI